MNQQQAAFVSITQAIEKIQTVLEMAVGKKP